MRHCTCLSHPVPRRQQGGFTLMEIVVAMAIAAVVVLMGTSALSTVSGVQRRHAVLESREEARNASIAVLRHVLQTHRGLSFATARVMGVQNLMPDARTAILIPNLAIFRCMLKPDGLFDLLHWTSPRAKWDSASRSFVPLPVKTDAVPKDADVLIQGMTACGFEYGLLPSKTGEGRWQPEWPIVGQPPSLLRIQWESKPASHPRLVLDLRSAHA